jgi:hypothetical protein
MHRIENIKFETEPYESGAHPLPIPLLSGLRFLFVGLEEEQNLQSKRGFADALLAFWMLLPA